MPNTLVLFQDHPTSEPLSATFEKDEVLRRLRALDEKARRKGLESLEASRNRLIRLGMEIDSGGRVTKNSYGVFHLSWLAENRLEWPARVTAELKDISERFQATHGVPLRFLIWAGMGGSAEDKSAYNAIGLLRRGPRVYVLDSTDPAKLKSILAEMERRSRLPLPEVLKRTLVVGMALGMTSYEPVVNLEKLAVLYDRFHIDSRPNFIYMTLPGSLLDQFGSQRGYRKIELQLDDGNGTSGRHSSPLTRGSLYPLGLAGIDLAEWMRGTFLSDEDIASAWRLAAFLHAQGESGRDKVTLLLPKAWEPIGLWTKQDFEESLGKREDLGIKIVIDEKIKLANYRSPIDARQDRLFLAVQVKGMPGPDSQKIGVLRRAGYPLAVLTLPKGTPLSAYMQFIHYTVFGVAYLRDMNFVTQPSVELYKAITNRLFNEAQKAGGLEKTSEWQKMKSSARQVRYRGALTLYFNRIEGLPEAGKMDAPETYAHILKALVGAGRIEYGELTFFGDTRYAAAGRAVRKCLAKAGETVFRARLKMPVDVYEGPAMNHSYHEMIIGHGKCLSTVLISEKAERIPQAGYTAEYHMAQYLATQMALAERGRDVVALSLKDLEEDTLEMLDEFFRKVAGHLRSWKV